MAKKQVADLHARLTADVTQYDGEMRKAAAITARTNGQINKSFEQMQRGGLKVGMGMLGAASATALFGNHVKNVIRDIDKIPGISPDVVDTINSAKAGVAGFENDLKRATATLASFFVKASQGVGLGIGALFYGSDAAREAAKRMQEEGRNFYKTQPQYVDALKKATEDLAAAEKKLMFAGEGRGEGADRKMREALASREAARAIKDELEQKLALVAAVNQEADAAKEMFALDDRMQAARSKAGQALSPMIGASLKGKEAVDAMREAITRLQYEIAQLDTQTAAGMEVATRKWEEMGKLAEDLNKATAKTHDFARDMGFAFASAFEDAVLSGQKLSGVVNGLVNDIARMLLRLGVINPIMNSMFGNTAGWTGLASLWGGARAGGGDVSNGSTYLVGEKGPELFTPKGSGTIIPNHKLGGGGRGDTFNATYNIGAGVTAQQLMPILAMHKRDVISTLADAKRRRTGAMAGA
jgi:uncharacterized phage infection (PIP) family protein YhgE